MLHFGTVPLNKLLSTHYEKLQPQIKVIKKVTSDIKFEV